MAKLQTISIKGKEYVTVNERLKYFREKFPNYGLLSEIIQMDAETVTIKATIFDENSRPLASGLASEDKMSSMINKTSYVENCECVPIWSEILTKDGFKFPYQLKEGEQVLTCNLDTMQNEWNPVERIATYKDQSTITASTSRFSATFTPNHKWIVRGKLKEFSEMGASDKITLAPNATSVKPSVIGRKLGWLLTDANIKYSESGMPSNAYITQAKYINDVTELFGDGKLLKNYNEKWKPCYRWSVSGEEVREIFGYFGISNYKELPKVVMKFKEEDLLGIYQSMMLADGIKNKGFGKTDYELVEAMQIICSILGFKTGKITSRMSKNSTRPVYILPIHKTNGAYFSELKIRRNPPQDVWCPTVKNGNWVMRQDGYVSFTGNTSAWGRALANFGIGIDANVASADELNNALERQEVMKSKIDKTKIAALKIAAEGKGIAIDMVLTRYDLNKIEDMNMEQWASAMSAIEKTEVKK